MAESVASKGKVLGYLNSATVGGRAARGWGQTLKKLVSSVQVKKSEGEGIDQSMNHCCLSIGGPGPLPVDESRLQKIPRPMEYHLSRGEEDQGHE